MDIKEELESLYHKRSLQYMEQFETDSFIKDKILEQIKSQLYKKGGGCIVISPLYSSFITRSYKCRMGIYDGELYLGAIDRAVYMEIPLISTYIEEDIEYIRDILLTDEKLSINEKKDIEYNYSIKYMELMEDVFKDTVKRLDEYLKSLNEGDLLDGVRILFGLYMEQCEELLVGGKE